MARKDIINRQDIGNKAEAFEAFDDIPTNPHLDNTIGDILNRRYGRRDFLKGSLGVSAAAALFGPVALGTARPVTAAATDAEAAKLAAATSDRFKFSELASGNDETHHIAEGYDANILLRWGDPITADAPEFDVQNQSAAAQLQQFGYNNDYVGYTELEPGRGLLCVNHEYTNEEVMFPKLGRQDVVDFEGMTSELADIEMAAHGGTVVEIARQENGQWALVKDSKYNRRITANDTTMSIDGPAAGHGCGYFQQLRRWHDALGHLPDGRREFSRLLLD
jgi:secreted PhoX family phosphatase